MATNPKDTAFPAYEPDYKMGHPIQQLTEAGLSKREYFAAVALQGCLASGNDVTSAVHLAVLAADRLITKLNTNQ